MTLGGNTVLANCTELQFLHENVVAILRSYIIRHHLMSHLVLCFTEMYNSTFKICGKKRIQL